MFRKIAAPLLFLFAPAVTYANAWLDSLCRVSEYVAMATVIKSYPSTPGAEAYMLDFRIIQIGAGGLHSGGPFLIHPGDTLSAKCTFLNCSIEYLKNETCFLPLVRDSNITGVAPKSSYTPLISFAESKWIVYELYNTVDLNCAISYKLSSNDSFTIVRTEQHGKWLKKTEMRRDSGIVSVMQRYEKPHEKGKGPYVTITKVRTWSADGEKASRYRRKRKHY